MGAEAVPGRSDRSRRAPALPSLWLRAAAAPLNREHAVQGPRGRPGSALFGLSSPAERRTGAPAGDSAQGGTTKRGSPDRSGPFRAMRGREPCGTKGDGVERREEAAADQRPFLQTAAADARSERRSPPRGKPRARGLPRSVLHGRTSNDRRQT